MRGRIDLQSVSRFTAICGRTVITMIHSVADSTMKYKGRYQTPSSIYHQNSGHFICTHFTKDTGKQLTSAQREKVFTCLGTNI